MHFYAFENNYSQDDSYVPYLFTLFFSFPLRFLTLFLIVDYIEYLSFFDQEKAMCIFESNKLRACMP